MPRRPFGQRDPTVRADALKRHALVRREDRRAKWLERAGVKPELYKEAIETLQAQMHATKLVPAVVDRKGNVVGERVEVPDNAIRLKAAAEIADHVRLVTGLTAATKVDKPSQAQVALVVNLPDWIVRSQPAQLEAAAPPRKAEPVDPVEAEPIVDAEITADERAR